MLDINALRQRMEGRTVAIVAQGKSVEELERRIGEFKDKNICWVSFSNFDIIDDYILSKIGKRCEMVFNAAPQEPDVERLVRVPNLIKVIDRGDLVITVINYITRLKDELKIDLLEQRRDKFILVREIKIGNKMPYNLNFGTNNTMSLVVACVLMANPQNIVLFGCDGVPREIAGGEPTVQTYYKHELIRPRKQRWSLHHDTDMTNQKFMEGYNGAVNMFGLSRLPQLYNCSPGSVLTCFQTVSYDAALNIIK